MINKDQPLKILLIGSGGREHALAWKLSQSPLCDQLFIAPGNPGTASCGTNVMIGVVDFKRMGEFALDQDISMVVVGPEVPLVEGISDYFSSNPELQKIAVIGPNASAARLEGSKAFSKRFMEKYAIPTAGYREFGSENLEEGKTYISSHKTPVVLKADGLAAGKGVLICQSNDEAVAEFEAMITNRKFGDASARVVVEEFLDGIELSVFALTDGKDYILFPTSKDYKRAGEGDSGLNTGGMGAVSPFPGADKNLMDAICARVIQPTINGLNSEGITYKGFIYFGLILVNGEPFVIEYNCRLGDPETQAVLPRLKSDLVELFLGVANNSIASQHIEEDARPMGTVILASGGYPGSYEKGKTISGIDGVERSLVFHAGTKTSDSKDLVTNGGRVLAVSSFGATLSDALEQSYQSVQKIDFADMYFRKDIGFDVV